MSLRSVRSQEVEGLEMAFCEEVFMALLDLNGYKVPKPGWFPYGFLAIQLRFCERQFWGCLGSFMTKGSFKKRLNTTFFVLIPKKGVVENSKNIKPINLVGNLCKLLAKSWPIGRRGWWEG